MFKKSRKTTRGGRVASEASEVSKACLPRMEVGILMSRLAPSGMRATISFAFVSASPPVNPVPIWNCREGHKYAHVTTRSHLGVLQSKFFFKSEITLEMRGGSRCN